MFDKCKLALTVETPDNILYIKRDESGRLSLAATKQGIESTLEFDQLFGQMEYPLKGDRVELLLNVLKNTVAHRCRRGTANYLFVSPVTYELCKRNFEQIDQEYRVTIDQDIPDGELLMTYFCIMKGNNVDAGAYYTPDGKLFVNPTLNDFQYFVRGKLELTTQ